MYAKNEGGVIWAQAEEAQCTTNSFCLGQLHVDQKLTKPEGKAKG